MTLLISYFIYSLTGPLKVHLEGRKLLCIFQRSKLLVFEQMDTDEEAKPTRKPRLVAGNDVVQMVHSQHYTGGKRMAVTTAGDNLVYTWTIRKTQTRTDGTKSFIMNCSECRSLKESKAKNNVYRNKDVPSRRAIEDLNGETFWAAEGTREEHFCKPVAKNTVNAKEIGRQVKRDLARGARKSTAAPVITSVAAAVAVQYAKEGPDVLKISRTAAIGKNKEAAMRAFERARSKRYKRVNNFIDLRDNDKLKRYRYTLRSNHLEGHEYFEEQMLEYADEDLAFFLAKPQKDMLRRSKYIVCDGTFKYAPKEAKHVFRMFGLIPDEQSDTFLAYPFVTALLTCKNEKIYKKLFRKVRDTLKEHCQDVNRKVKWKAAFLDCEIAAVKAFNKILSAEFKAKPFMCSFHVKAALNRYIQQNGLQEIYRGDENVQRVFRMIGALQIIDPVHWEKAIEAIHKIKDEIIEDDDLKNHLDGVFKYYKEQWLGLNSRLKFDFFSLHGLPDNAPRTTNIAEAYHSRQNASFSKKSLLGTWIADFQMNLNSEISICEEILSGYYHGEKQQARYKKSNEKILAAKHKLHEISLDATLGGEDIEDAIIDFLTTVGYAMGVKPAIAKKKVSIEGIEQEENDLESGTEEGGNDDKTNGDLQEEKNAGDITQDDAKHLDGKLQSDTNIKTISSKTINANKRSADVIIDKEVSRKKFAGSRIIHYVPLTSHQQKNLCKQFNLDFMENTTLKRASKQTFCADQGYIPLTRVKTSGDGNCYFRAISISISGTDSNHEKLRREMMEYALKMKATDALIASLHETASVTPSKRKSPAITAKDVNKYAQFPLDFVLASKYLQLNLLVFNEKKEWDVYRPDSTTCQPQLAIPQENIPTLAIEYKEDHIDVVRTIG